MEQQDASRSDGASGGARPAAILIGSSSTLTRLGDALANAKTVLTWLLAAAGAPDFVAGLLVPVRESGSMLPQAFLATRLRRLRRRKWAFVLGCAIQGGSVAAMAACGFFLSGASAGWGVLACVVLFSLARSLCSASSKDVLGKCIPKGRRGRLSGTISAVSGILTTGVGLSLFGMDGGGIGSHHYVTLLLAAAAGWWIAGALYAGVDEPPGDAEDADSSGVVSRSLRLLKEDARIRRFFYVRCLLVGTALAGPYFVLLGKAASGAALGALGLFVAAGGIASGLSAPVWGWLADRSSRKVLIASGALMGALSAAAFAVERLGPAPTASLYYPLLYTALTVIHTGVRLGRKTYVVDAATGNTRTDYVTVTNTGMGLYLLGAGTVAGAAATWLGPAEMILGFGALASIGAVAALTLPEVSAPAAGG